jgi:hypothetical protein
MDDLVKDLYAFAVNNGDVCACRAMIKSKEYGECLLGMKLTDMWLTTVTRTGGSVLTNAIAAYAKTTMQGQWKTHESRKKIKFTRGGTKNNRVLLTAKFKKRFVIKGFGGARNSLSLTDEKGVYKMKTTRFGSPAWVEACREKPHNPIEECCSCGSPSIWETPECCDMRRFVRCNRLRRCPTIATVKAREYNNTPVTAFEVSDCDEETFVKDGVSNHRYASVLPCYTKCVWNITVAHPKIKRHRRSTP